MFKLDNNNNIENNIFIPNTATAAAHNNNVYNILFLTIYLAFSVGTM